MDNDKSIHQSFIERLHKTIATHLNDEQFGVEELAQEMGVSKSQLHRKLRMIAGKSASQLIRESRLKKAMELLENEVLTVAEVAYQVGFNSPTYFNTCFHDFFGFPPGEVKFRKLANNKRRSSIPRNVIILTFAVAILLLIVYSLRDYLPLKTPDPKMVMDKSIAVLPFKNLSNNPGDRYLVDGVMEAILNHLQRMGDLSIRSSTSTEIYRDSPKNIIEIGKELGVNYIMAGSFQKVSDQVHLFVRLILAPSDEQLWAKEYTREWSQIFEVQSEVAMLVADELYANITREVKDAIEVEPTMNMDAYEYYLKGNDCAAGWTLETIDQYEDCADYYKKAIALDENFSFAYTGLGQVYWRGGQWIMDKSISTEMYRTSKESLTKAVELDPYNAWAYSELGVLQYRLERDSVQARINLEKAVKMAPKDWNALRGYFHYQYRLGNCDKLELIIDRMKTVNHGWDSPLKAHNLMLLECQNRYEEMVEIGDEYWDEVLKPNKYRAIFGAYLYNKNYDKAHSVLQYMNENYWDSSEKFQFLNAIVKAKEGDKEPAMKILNEISEKKNDSRYRCAMLYAALGDKDQMYEYIEKALSKREGWIVDLSIHSLLYSYQDEPRFKEIVDKSWVPLNRNMNETRQ